MLSGYSSTLVNVPMIGYFQKNVEIDQQTQFFSIMTLFSNIAVPLGTFIAGIMCELFGGDGAYLMNGIIMFIYLYIMRRDIKNVKIWYKHRFFRIIGICEEQGSDFDRMGNELKI